MKNFSKILFFFILCLFVLTKSESVFAQEDQRWINEGGALLVKPGIAYQRISRSDFNDIEDGDNYSAQMWQVAALYRYQARNRPYAYLKADYSKGEKGLSSRKHHLYKWNVEMALGWTWTILGKGLISPFISAGYNAFKDKRDADATYDDQNDSDDYSSIATKYFGYYGTLGLDFQYLFTSNFTLGALLGIGMHINPNITYNSFQTIDIGHEIRKKQKYKCSRTPFYRAMVNVLYHWNSTWRFGLEFEYNYHRVKTQSAPKYFLLGKDATLNLNHRIHRYMLSIVIGCPF